MKKGTILRNLWAGYETYFIYMGFPVHTHKMESKKTGGYSLSYIDGKWKFKRAAYYVEALRDTEHFPVVGWIDLKGIAVDAVLKAIAINGKPPKGDGE